MSIVSRPSSVNQIPSSEEVQQQLERIVGHELFRSSQRLSSFIRFAVERALEGRTGQLKEAVLGSEVFERGAAYNPQEDPVVRVMAGRLRARLAEYYQGAGATDPIRIDLPRGGYVPRFTWQQPPALAAASEVKPVSARAVVGRDRELELIEAAFRAAATGAGSMLAISGDPGMGKTTLVEEFLADLGNKAWVVRGRGSERLAETDAFVPIYDALDRLLRSDHDGSIAGLIRSVAPSWYVQVASALPEAMPIEIKSISHDRMRREIVTVLDRLGMSRTVVLFLDDLHWADASTCDLLTYLGDRLRDMKIIVLATYRPPELLARKNPFLAVKLNLERAGLCQEVPLSYLNAAEIQRYTEIRFPTNQFPVELSRTVFERTEGNPLFMTDLFGFLIDRGILVDRLGCWQLEYPLEEVRSLIPTGVKRMVELKIGRFSAEDRDLLYCAAVQGVQFDSAVLAGVLQRDSADVEERLQELDAFHNFIRYVGEHEFPNGGPSVRYRFVHVFYQNALLDSLVPSRRATYGLSIAETLERLSGEKSHAIAADLALLFEAGRAFEKASQYFLDAARNAVRVFAYPEAAILCQRGLTCLEALPVSEQREGRELLFLLTHGMSLMATQGYAAPEVEAAYRRSYELCVKLNQHRRLFPVLWGLHTCKIIAGELQSALEVARNMREVAEASKNVSAIVESLHGLGTTLAFMGRLAEAREALEQIPAIYAVQPPPPPGSLFMLEAQVTSLSMLARLLAQMGYVDQALVKAKASVALAEGLSHPHSLAYATFWVGWIHHARGEYSDACHYIEPAMELSRDFPQILEWGRVVRGSALTRLGRVEEGIAGIRESMDRQLAMRSMLERSFCYTLLAEALTNAGAHRESLAAADEGLDFAQRTAGRCYEPETYRIRGEALLALGGEEQLLKAEQEILRALTVAEAAQSRLLELRAAQSYVRVCDRLGEGRRGRVRLQAVIDWFTEGGRCPEILDARAALR